MSSPIPFASIANQINYQSIPDWQASPTSPSITNVTTSKINKPLGTHSTEMDGFQILSTKPTETEVTDLKISDAMKIFQLRNQLPDASWSKITGLFNIGRAKKFQQSIDKVKNSYFNYLQSLEKTEKASQILSETHTTSVSIKSNPIDLTLSDHKKTASTKPVFTPADKRKIIHLKEVDKIKSWQKITQLFNEFREQNGRSPCKLKQITNCYSAYKYCNTAKQSFGTIPDVDKDALINTASLIQESSSQASDDFKAASLFFYQLAAQSMENSQEPAESNSSSSSSASSTMSKQRNKISTEEWKIIENNKDKPNSLIALELNSSPFSTRENWTKFHVNNCIQNMKKRKGIPKHAKVLSRESIAPKQSYVETQESNLLTTSKQALPLGSEGQTDFHFSSHDTFQNPTFNTFGLSNMYDVKEDNLDFTDIDKTDLSIPQIGLKRLHDDLEEKFQTHKKSKNHNSVQSLPSLTSLSPYDHSSPFECKVLNFDENHDHIVFDIQNPNLEHSSTYTFSQPYLSLPQQSEQSNFLCPEVTSLTLPTHTFGFSADFLK